MSLESFKRQRDKKEELLNQISPLPEEKGGTLGKFIRGALFGVAGTGALASPLIADEAMRSSPKEIVTPIEIIQRSPRVETKTVDGKIITVVNSDINGQFKVKAGERLSTNIEDRRHEISEMSQEAEIE